MATWQSDQTQKRYILNYLDRNNIAAARLAGLEEELNLHGTQYQTAGWFPPPQGVALIHRGTNKKRQGKKEY